MLLPIKRLIGTPILSLQTGSELAKISGVIIDPRKLTIVALRVSGSRLNTAECVLHPEDIREISDIGVIIDSNDQLMETDGLVRLEEVINFAFTLEGCHVEDEQHNKLGSVKDYALDPESFIVQQLYVQPPLFRSLSVSILTIHRSQIVSITNQKIVVKDAAIKDEKPLEEVVKTTLTNPFRTPAPTQPESKEL